MEGSSEGNHATFWMDDPERSCQPLGMYSVIRVNPIFFDDDYGNSSLRGLPQTVARAYGATPPESPGKSGSSGYESNACSEEACRWDEETRGSSRRSFEPRTSRRHSNTLARTKRDARGEDPHQHHHHHHGEDEESSPSRAVLAPIPEGKVGGLPLLTATPIPTFLRTCSNPEVDVEVRRKPGSIPEVHERSEGKRKEDQESIRPSRGNGKRRRTRFGAERERRAPSSYPGNASGKKLLKKAEEIIRWGNNRTESDREDCKRIHTAARGKGAVTGEDSDRTKARILRSSPSSSAASSVSSGFTVPPLRKTLLGPREDEQNKWRQKDVEVISEKSQRRSKSGGGGVGAAKLSQESPAEENKKTASQDAQNQAQRDVETSTRGTIRGLSAVDVCEKLKALDLDARSSLGAVDKDGGDYGKPGWDNYGDGSGGTSPFTRKCKECSTVFHVSKAYPLITNNGPFGDHVHLDFTLDVPRAERLLLQIAAAKRRRCCIRLAGAAFALVFFLISVVVVSMLYSRGKRVFGPL